MPEEALVYRSRKIGVYSNARLRCTAASFVSRFCTTTIARVLMCEIPIRDFEAEGRFVLGLSTHPHAKLQNGLEFIGRIVPPLIVAKRMCRHVVVGSVSTTGAMRKGLICLPYPINGAAADVATTFRSWRIPQMPQASP